MFAPIARIVIYAKDVEKLADFNRPTATKV